jgi:hypothetical protein
MFIVFVWFVPLSGNFYIHKKNLRIDTPNRTDMRNFVSCVSVFHLQIKTIHFKSPNYKKTCFSADSFCYAKIKDKSLFDNIIGLGTVGITINKQAEIGLLNDFLGNLTILHNKFSEVFFELIILPCSYCDSNKQWLVHILNYY